jgi:hypothetical protein
MSYDVLVSFLMWTSLIYGCVVIARGGKKFLSSSPEVSDAAKKAASAKAINLIGKLLK